MCGGFASTVGSRPSGAAAWHLGRLSTYALLGALAGAVGQVLPGPSWLPAVVATVLLCWFALAIAGLVLFGIGWGFFDCNNMPILCQIARPELRATGYGLMNFVSMTFGGVADWIFGILTDRHTPLNLIFTLFATLALISIGLVLAIRPQPNAPVGSP